MVCVLKTYMAMEITYVGLSRHIISGQCVLRKSPPSALGHRRGQLSSSDMRAGSNPLTHLESGFSSSFHTLLDVYSGYLGLETTVCATVHSFRILDRSKRSKSEIKALLDV